MNVKENSLVMKLQVMLGWPSNASQQTYHIDIWFSEVGSGASPSHFTVVVMPGPVWIVRMLVEEDSVLDIVTRTKPGVGNRIQHMLTHLTKVLLEACGELPSHGTCISFEHFMTVNGSYEIQSARLLLDCKPPDAPHTATAVPTDEDAPRPAMAWVDPEA